MRVMIVLWNLINVVQEVSILIKLLIISAAQHLDYVGINLNFINQLMPHFQVILTGLHNVLILQHLCFMMAKELVMNKEESQNYVQIIHYYFILHLELVVLKDLVFQMENLQKDLILIFQIFLLGGRNVLTIQNFL